MDKRSKLVTEAHYNMIDLDKDFHEDDPVMKCIRERTMS